MLNVTESACKEIGRYFEDKEVQPIRIFLNQGCSGPHFAMAVDTPGDDDKTFNQDGYTYIIDKALLVQAQPIKVDFNELGFEITSSLELGGGCGSCCGNCGTD